MTRSALARSLLRLYPRRWRRRYEAELLALVEDVGLSRSGALDLLWGALVERAREFGAATFAVLATTQRERNVAYGPLPTALLALALAAPIQLATVVVARTLPPFSWPSPWDAVFAALLLLFYGGGLIRLIALRGRRPHWSTDAAFRRRLDAFPAPRLNRAVATFSYRVFGIGAPYQERWAAMTTAEGLAWAVGAVGGRVAFGWVVGAPVDFGAWATSFYTGQFVVVMARAVARRHRFGPSGASPGSHAPIIEPAGPHAD